MSSRQAFHHLYVIMLFAAGGCAQFEWQKPGTAAADVERDQAQCTVQGRFEARQRMPLQPSLAPQVIMDQQGRTIVTQNTQPDSERFFLENSLLRQCMTKLGYTLQPSATAVRPE